jgi:arsenite/tail-anchored protein-transporting ATPase
MGLPDLKAEVVGLLMDTENPPPGTDEIVAMTRIIGYMDQGMRLPNGEVVTFDRIVLDTAPTGHTLRMLSLPAFLQDVVDKVRSLQSKTGGMFGGAGAGTGVPEAGDVEEDDRLTRFQDRMGRLEDVLHNPSESEFTIVTIPTQLATAETGRLVKALAEDSVAVRRIVVNQVLPVGQTETVEAAEAFLSRMRLTQQDSMRRLQDLAARASNVQLKLVEVPYFDTELRTVFGLRLLSQALLGREEGRS